LVINCFLIQFDWEKRAMSAKLSVYTFGGLRILEAGELVEGVESRKIEALLIYLAMAERPQPREVLADLLWDDRSQQQASANLRRVLLGLRKHFGAYVEITRANARMDWEAELWLDAREIRMGKNCSKLELLAYPPRLFNR
jgi:DNA-binding SARP family transcriptional activator